MLVHTCISVAMACYEVCGWGHEPCVRVVPTNCGNRCAFEPGRNIEVVYTGGCGSARSDISKTVYGYNAAGSSCAYERSLLWLEVTTTR